MTEQIRIKDLEYDKFPSTEDFAVADGDTTRRSRLLNIADVVRPYASAPEAQTGEATGKVMDPLRGKDAIVAIGGALFATTGDVSAAIATSMVRSSPATARPAPTSRTTSCPIGALA